MQPRTLHIVKASPHLTANMDSCDPGDHSPACTIRTESTPRSILGFRLASLTCRAKCCLGQDLKQQQLILVATVFAATGAEKGTTCLPNPPCTGLRHAACPPEQLHQPLGLCQGLGPQSRSAISHECSLCQQVILSVSGCNMPQRIHSACLRAISDLSQL